MEALNTSLSIGALRGQDEIRQLSCFCRPETAPSSENSEARLRKVADSFEAIFARQLLREMRDSVLKSSLFGEGTASEVYQEMFDDHLAEAIGKAGGFGLGDVLVQQLRPERPRLSPEEALELYKNQDVKNLNETRLAEGIRLEGEK